MRGLRVDFRKKVVVLLPVCVRRVEVLEVLHEPRAVELSVPDVARERGERGSAEQAAAVTHRIEAAHVTVPALTHHVPKQDAALRQVNQVVTRGRDGVKRAQYATCALNV